MRLSLSLGRFSRAGFMLSFLFWAGPLHAEFDDMLMKESDFSESLKSFEKNDDAWAQMDREGPRPWQFFLSPAYPLLVGPPFEHTDYGNGPAVEAGLYYQCHPWWQLGVEGGYSFSHVDKESIVVFDGIDFYVEEKLEVAHVTPSIRFGPWIAGPGSKRWKPYLQAGAGWYQIFQKTNLKIEANQFLFRYQLEQTTNDYLGANAGGGIELEINPQAVIGLHMAYHQVFSSPDNLQFFSPGLRFSYLF